MAKLTETQLQNSYDNLNIGEGYLETAIELLKEELSPRIIYELQSALNITRDRLNYMRKQYGDSGTGEIRE